AIGLNSSVVAASARAVRYVGPGLYRDPRSRVRDAIPRFAWPTDAERRRPSRDPGAPPARAGTPSARAVEVLVCRAGPGGPGPDQRAPRPAAGRRAAGGRPAAGT